MSPTLFRYIFRDLLRIFFLTSGVLSAIMSFGGLLRPLYEFGLDIGQVAKILSYSSPAMTAYSLPIAALFATTIVYGRFGADNETTACRAAGISYLSMSFPAVILGLCTALASLGLLCFIVPSATLKVEKVIYSNLAKLVASQIERSHQIRYMQSRSDEGSVPMTVFAQSAKVLPIDPTRPREQAVELTAPLIVTYQPAEKNRPAIPEEFYTAQKATARIGQGSGSSDDEFTLLAELSNGTKFPRALTGTARQDMQATIGTTRFGPTPLRSPVKENTKFMDVLRLRSLLTNPEQSRNIRETLRGFISRDQARDFLAGLAKELNGPNHRVELSGANETYDLICGAAPAQIQKEQLILNAEDPATTMPATQPSSPARLTETRGALSGVAVDAKTIRVRAYPDPDRRQVTLEIDMLGCTVRVENQTSAQRNFSRLVTVDMPDEVFAATTRPAEQYIRGSLSSEDRLKLSRDLIKLTNSVISELHARISFAVSCFMLVMVGCALGMMFRSGNFLSAFAVSVVPALACIALVVTGQHTCENIPWRITDPNWVNPLTLGLWIIWAGNIAVAIVAVSLLARLQKQ